MHMHIHTRIHANTCGFESPLTAEVSAITWRREDSDHLANTLIFPCSNLLVRVYCCTLRGHLQQLELLL